MAFSGLSMGLAPLTFGTSLLADKAFGGMFGNKAPNFDNIIAQRERDIDAFQGQLTLAQNNVMSNYQNLQTTTMNRFMPDLTAYLSGRGLAPNGGAFASAVAHEATGLQGQYDAMNAQMTEQNLNTIGNMRSQLFGQTLGLQSFPQMANYQNRSSMLQGFGNLLGTGLGAMIGGPTGSGFGSMLGRSVFGGTSGNGTYSVFGSNTGYGGQGNLNLPMRPMVGGYGY